MNRTLTLCIVIAVVAVVVGGGGCASYEPMPLDPLSELQSLDHRATNQTRLRIDTRAGDRRWFPLARVVDPRNGITLAEANSLALQFAPALVSLRAELVAQQALSGDAGKPQNPTLFLGPRWSLSGAGMVLPVSLTWSLPLGGALAAEGDLATAQVDEATWALRAAELQTLGRVRELFATHAVAQEQLAVHATAVSDIQRLADWSAALADAGAIDEVSLGLVQLTGAEIQVACDEATALLDRTRSALLALLGLPPSPGLRLVSRGAKELPAVPDSQTDHKALLAHPKVKLAEAQYTKSEQTLRLEVARQRPWLQVGGEAETSDDDEQLGFGLGLPLPLFQHNNGAIAAAKARRRGARAQLQTTLIELRHALALAQADLARLKMQQQRGRAHGQLVAQSRAALHRRLEGGQADVVELIEVMEIMRNVQLRELELEGEMATQRIRLALHGGVSFAAVPTPDTE